MVAVHIARTTELGSSNTYIISCLIKEDQAVVLIMVVVKCNTLILSGNSHLLISQAQGEGHYYAQKRSVSFYDSIYFDVNLMFKNRRLTF